MVVELDPVPDLVTSVWDGVVGVEINLFVFEAAPEALNEDVVDPAAFAIHADFYVSIFEYLGKCLTGELAALVGVEDFGRAVVMQGIS